MTIGPEPITRTFLISVRLGMGLRLLHHGNKLIDQADAGAGAFCIGGLELYGENLIRCTFDADDRIVKDVDVGHGQTGAFNAVRGNGIVVILNEVSSINSSCNPYN